MQPEEEDDNVDAAINATKIGSKSNIIAVELPSSRGPPNPREVPPPEAPPTRFRARRFKPGVSSVEIFNHEISPLKAQKRRLSRTVPESPPSAQPPRPAPNGKGKGKAVSRRSESPDQRQGSPELQSSALKRRHRRRPRDVYDVPGDEEEEEGEPPSPLAPQRLRPARGKARAPKKSRRERHFAQSKRLSSIREEQNSGPGGTPSSSAAAARQAPAQRRPPGRAAALGRDHERSNAFVEDEEDEEDEQHSDEDVEEDEEAEEDEEHSDEDVEEAQLSVLIQVLPYNPSHRPISVSSDHLDNMLGTLGRVGWTGEGPAWSANLRRLSEPGFGGRPPARTKRGRRLFESLSSLIDELEEVPNALDLAGQAQCLEAGQAVLNSAMSSVNDAVNTAETSAAAAAAHVASPTDSPFLIALVDDLSVYIIPLLVMSLQAAFSIGVAQPDAESSEFIHADGTFTSTTVQYAMWISAWLSRLEALLPKPNPPEDQVQNRNPPPYDPDDRVQNRERFGTMLRKWNQHLKAAVREYNENADRERDIAAKQQKDAAVRAQRERQKREQLGRDMDQQAVFLEWVRNVGTRPRPLAEMFHRTVAHWPQVAAAPAAPLHQDWAQQELGWSSPARSQTAGRASRLFLPPPPPSPPQQPQPPSESEAYPPWPQDEVDWLLGELARPDWGPGQLELCAETLDRPVAEVRMEMERLARGRMERLHGF